MVLAVQVGNVMNNGEMEIFFFPLMTSPVRHLRGLGQGRLSTHRCRSVH